MNIKDVEAIYGLSPLQEELLLHAGPTGRSFAQCYQLLRGSFDAALCERAWQQVAAAHPELRTTFAWKLLDKPVQLVHKQMASAPAQADWRALPGDQQAENLRALLRAEQARACDPAKPTLVRLFVCRLTDDAWQLVLSYHPLLLDAPSAGRIVAEIRDCYACLRERREAGLARVPPFKDYINWLKTQDWTQTKIFWQQLLQDYGPAGPALTHSARAAIASGDECVVERFLSPAETPARLRSFAREQQLPLPVLLHGLWAVLLSRYGGAGDVLCGLTLSQP